LVGEWGWRCQNLTKKYMVMMWSWKRSKTSWIGHGAWMGIEWGNMEDGHMGLKHSSWHVTCFGGLGCLGIETCLGSLVETWYVSIGGRFQGSSFEVHVLWCAIFNRLKWMLGCWMPLKHDMFSCWLLRSLCCPYMETHAKTPWNEWCI